jgi:hypothetical protein
MTLKIHLSNIFNAKDALKCHEKKPLKSLAL